jgi:hypothetical protein
MPLTENANALLYSNDTNIAYVDASFVGEDPDERLGASVTVLGDVNGDGKDDFAFAGSKFSGTSNMVGNVWIYFGNDTGWSRNDIHYNAHASLNGGSGFHVQDMTVSGAGDVNGDGFDDIIVGQPLISSNGDRSGKVWLHFGKATGWRTGYKLWDANASFIGEGGVNFAGYYISEAGDVNGDGFDDFLIGAYGNSNYSSFGGKCYLIFGKSSGWEMDVDLSSVNASFYGERSNAYLGKVAAAGDVNGDNYDDFLLGAWRDRENGPVSGQTYLFLGKASGWQGNTSVTNADASFHGEHANDMSARALDGAGDVNGDGLDDIIVGSRYNDDTDGDAGEAYILFGKRTGWSMDTNLSDANVTLLADYSNEEAGRCVAGVGDVNGDGYDDVMVGAPRYGELPGTSGRVFLVLGRGTGWSKSISLTDAAVIFLGEEPGSMTGEAIAGGGDINGDGYDDVVVGAPEIRTTVTNGGKVYLIFPDANTPLTSVSSVTLYSDEDYTKEATSAYMNTTIYVRVTGTGGNASRADITVVRVTSDSTSPVGFLLRLQETGINTNTFEGSFRLGIRTHERYRWIGTDLGDLVNVTSITDVQKWDSLWVTARPVISNKPTHLDATEDVSFEYTLIVDEGIIASTVGTSNANWLNWNSTNLSLYGTPTNLDVGTYWMFINVSDEFGNGDEVNFTITVINAPPEITGTPPVTATEDELWSFDFDSTDDGQGNITWNMITSASWLAINSTHGIILGTPSNDNVGPHWVNVSVNDGNNGSAFIIFSLEVLNVNDAPSIITDALPDAKEDVAYSFQINASDPDKEDTEHWSMDTDADWLEIDAETGTLFGTPSNDDVGSFNVTITITDSGDASASKTLTLSVVNVNNLPEILTEDITSAEEDEPYRVVYEATDPDFGETLSWTFISDAAWLEFDTDTGLLSGIPDNDDVGEYWVNVTVTDSSGASVSHNFTLTVSNTNDPPQIDSTNPPTSAMVGLQYSYQVLASDVDEGESLSYSLDTKPLGMEMDEDSGLVQWIPQTAQVGVHAVVVRVSDGEIVVRQFFNITVNPETPNTKPAITSFPDKTKLAPGEEFTYPVIASDPDVVDVLTFMLVDSPLLMTIDSASGLIEWIPKEDDIGEHQVTVRVIDSRGGTADQTFTLMVEKADTNGDTNGDHEEGGQPWWLIPLLLILVIVGAIAAVILTRKKPAPDDRPPTIDDTDMDEPAPSDEVDALLEELDLDLGDIGEAYEGALEAHDVDGAPKETGWVEEASEGTIEDEEAAEDTYEIEEAPEGTGWVEDASEETKEVETAPPVPVPPLEVPSPVVQEEILWEDEHAKAKEVREVMNALTSMPKGLPTSLWGWEVSGLAKAVVEGERKEASDGTELVKIKNKWYTKAPEESHEEQLKKLEKGFLEGRISEETYKELKRKFEGGD